MVEERSKEREMGFWRALQNAKLSLFIWRSPGCKHVSVKELSEGQIERAVMHFDSRRQECIEELARRKGEPRPDFWAHGPISEERGHNPERYA